MYNSNLENSLILVDIVDALQDYVSLQPDIDETRVKAAQIIAIKLDIERLIGADNVARCVDPQDAADDELLEMITPPLCYFTYARLLKNFQGSYSDSGYSTEQEADDKNTAKAVSNEMASVAETFMEPVIAWLKEEDPLDQTIQEAQDKLTPRIRTFGGNEWRGSN